MKLLATAFAILMLAAARSSNKGDALDEFCLGRDFDGKCNLCTLAYPDQGICFRAPTPIEHCLLYWTKSTCRICAFGYESSDDGSSCDLIAQENCLMTLSPPKGKHYCYACGEQVLVDATAEAFTCTDRTRKCADVNCEVCGAFKHRKNLQTCFLCKQGFVGEFDVSWKMVCVPALNDLANCHYKHRESGKCVKCRVNYAMTPERTCVHVTKYYASYYEGDLGADEKFDELVINATFV